MKGLSLFIFCCSAMFFLTNAAHAQSGFTGPVANQPSGAAQSGPIHNKKGSEFGFTGPSRVVTTEQAKTFAHRTPVLIRGSIVQYIGANLYTFRDSSGEIIVRIGSKEWNNFGSNIGASDKIEINGKLHRNKKDFQKPAEIHAKSIKKM